jgi:hypothetical protein
LFGTGDTKASMETGWDGHTMRLSYGKYPALPGVLLDLLKSGQQIMERGKGQATAAEAVFPVLDIIRRAGPPEDCRGELYEYIQEYLGSHIWHVREIAARTLCSFLITGGWVGEIKRLLLRAETDSNRTHGALLALRFVLERKLELDDGNLPSKPSPLCVLGRGKC